MYKAEHEQNVFMKGSQEKLHEKCEYERNLAGIFLFGSAMNYFTHNVM